MASDENHSQPTGTTNTTSALDNALVNDPNFATICSFIEKFGEICHIGNLPFSQLQEMLENTNDVPLPLVQLHIRLLRRVFKSINTSKWEKSVSKFAHMYNSQDGWEVERFGYKKSKVQTKLRILKNLLESQFDYNPKFKGEVNKLPASDLRLAPLGRDAQGHCYWCHVDQVEANLRVYREDVEGETWEIVASSREEMEQLIIQLQSGEIRKAKSVADEEGIEEEDETNGMTEVEILKDILLDTGKALPEDEEADIASGGCSELSDESNSLEISMQNDEGQGIVNHLEQSDSALPIAIPIESTSLSTNKNRNDSDSFDLVNHINDESKSNTNENQVRDCIVNTPVVPDSTIISSTSSIEFNTKYSDNAIIPSLESAINLDANIKQENSGEDELIVEQRDALKTDSKLSDDSQVSKAMEPSEIKIEPINIQSNDETESKVKEARINCTFNNASTMPTTNMFEYVNQQPIVTTKEETTLEAKSSPLYYYSGNETVSPYFFSRGNSHEQDRSNLSGSMRTSKSPLPEIHQQIQIDSYKEANMESQQLTTPITIEDMKAGKLDTVSEKVPTDMSVHFSSDDINKFISTAVQQQENAKSILDNVVDKISVSAPIQSICAFEAANPTNMSTTEMKSEIQLNQTTLDNVVTSPYFEKTKSDNIAVDTLPEISTIKSDDSLQMLQQDLPCPSTTLQPSEIPILVPESSNVSSSLVANESEDDQSINSAVSQCSDPNIFVPLNIPTVPQKLNTFNIDSMLHRANESPEKPCENIDVAGEKIEQLPLDLMMIEQLPFTSTNSSSLLVPQMDPSQPEPSQTVNNSTLDPVTTDMVSDDSSNRLRFIQEEGMPAKTILETTSVSHSLSENIIKPTERITNEPNCILAPEIVDDDKKHEVNESKTASEMQLEDFSSPIVSNEKSDLSTIVQGVDTTTILPDATDDETMNDSKNIVNGGDTSKSLQIPQSQSTESNESAVTVTQSTDKDAAEGDNAIINVSTTTTDNTTVESMNNVQITESSSEPNETAAKDIKTNPLGLVGYDCSSSEEEDNANESKGIKESYKTTDSVSTTDDQQILTVEKSLQVQAITHEAGQVNIANKNILRTGEKAELLPGGQKRKLEQEPDSNLNEQNPLQIKTRKISSDNPIVGEEIEEAVIFVTGSGEGALNEGGNETPPTEPLHLPPSSEQQHNEEQVLNSSSMETDTNTPPVKHKGRGRPRKNPPKEVLKDKNVSSSTTVSPEAKKNRRNSFADEVNGVVSSGSVRRSGRVAQIRQKEEEDRRRLEEERLAQLKEAQVRKKQKQLERELKAAKEGVPLAPKTPKMPKTPKTPKSAKVGKPKLGSAAKQQQQISYIPPSSEEDSDTEEEADDVEEYDAKPGKKGRKKRAKNGKGIKRGAQPWLHSSSEEDEQVEEEEEHYDEEEEEEESWKLKEESDHEFSPESDLEDEEFSPSRHARTAKQKDGTIGPSAKVDRGFVEKYAETYCEKCAKGDHPEWILLCDSCDHGWHASCVYPQLWVIPEGEWFCPPCQHRMLVEKLSENLVEFDKVLKKRENEVLRKQRLAYVGISLNNVLPSAEKPPEKSDDENGEEEHTRKRSRRRRMYSDEEIEDFINDGDEDDKSSSGSGSYESEDEPMYQLRARRATKSFSFREYDDMINTALGDDSMDGQEEQPAEAAAGDAEGEDAGNENDEESSVKAVKVPDSGGGGKKMPDESESDEEYLDEKEKNRRKMLKQSQRKSRRRLNDLDATSEEDSDEDFKGSGGDEDEEDEEDVVEDDSEWSGDESDDSIAVAKLSRRKRKHRHGPLGRQEKYLDGETVRRSTRRRKSRVVYDESDQEEDEDDQTEKWQSGESENSDEDEDDEESDDETWGKKKKQKKVAASKTKLPNFFLGGSGPNAFKKPKKKKRRRLDEDDVDRAWTNKFGNKAKKLSDEPVERKTRGKQINFKDILDSGESDDDGNIRPKRRRILSDSEDDDDDEIPSSSRKLVEEIKAANAQAAKDAVEEKLKQEAKLHDMAEPNKIENENIQVKALQNIVDLPPVAITEPDKEEERPVKITNSIVESILMRKTPDIDSPVSTPPPVVNEEPYVPQQSVGPLVGVNVPSYLATVLGAGGSARVGKKKTASMMPVSANQSGDVLPFPSSSSKKSGVVSIPVPPKSLAGALASSSSPVLPSSSSIPRSILPPNIPSELSRIAAPMYPTNPALRSFTPWGRSPPPYTGPPLGKPPPLNSSFMPQPGQLRQPPTSYASAPSAALRIPNPNTLQAFQQFGKRSADVGPHYRMPGPHQIPSSVLPSMTRERIFLGGASPYAPYGMLPQSQQHPALFAPPPFDYRAAESFKEELLERHSQQLHPPIGPPTTISSAHVLGQHLKGDDMNHPPTQGDGEFGGLVSYFSSQHSNDED